MKCWQVFEHSVDGVTSHTLSYIELQSDGSFVFLAHVPLEHHAEHGWVAILVGEQDGEFVSATGFDSFADAFLSATNKLDAMMSYRSAGNGST